MAIVTQLIQSFNEGDVVYEVDISTADGLTGVVTGFRATSKSGAAASGEIYNPTTGVKYTNNILPGVTVPLVTPVLTTQANKIPATWNATKNRWVGFRGNFQGPVSPVAAVKS